MSLPLYFTCVARIITSSLSLGILSMKHGRIFPLPPPPLLRLQHKPSRGNNKQMREMGTVPSESSQVLWQPSINALVPRPEEQKTGLSLTVSVTEQNWKNLTEITVTCHFYPHATGHTLTPFHKWRHRLRNWESFLQQNISGD